MSQEKMPDKTIATHLSQRSILFEALDSAMSSTGREMLKRWYKTGKITRSQAMTAMCCDCCGHYVDGREDCQNPNCPLYPWMPYRVNDLIKLDK